eukprot:TRINITY_DN98539_c0_g1_i1.p1 TRINITY_DN98539_c0_g1~~TRINITY_DN98539_c0_g1_i1.p1  ORF type:complete len:102 (+),score=10.14 TRINITY_DN98539_c0_g1_i1:87-392(+)
MVAHLDAVAAKKKITILLLAACCFYWPSSMATHVPAALQSEASASTESIYCQQNRMLHCKKMYNQGKISDNLYVLVASVSSLATYCNTHLPNVQRTPALSE